MAKHAQGAILDAFDKHGTKSERDKIWTMRGCLHRTQWRECPDGHEGRMHQAEFCGQRLCPICQKRRAILAKKKYRPAMQAAIAGEYTGGEKLYPLFVTLTWPSMGHLDNNHLGRLWKDLAKLKRQKWWASLVRAETWSFEWTFSAAFGHHPHVHGVIMVPYSQYEKCVQAYKAAKVGKKESKEWWAKNGPLPKPVLSEAWEKLTGAPVVDVRRIKSRRKDWGTQEALLAALDEVLKYPMKESDYLEDRPLRKDEVAEIDRRDGEIYDREEALVELFRAIRGRRLTDVRGCIRGKLLAAMEEVEEAKGDDLLRMDEDEFAAYGTRCTCCNKEYVEREWVYSFKHGGYFLGSESPLGTAFAHFDGEARRVIQAANDREVLRIMAKVAGRAWSAMLKRRAEWRKRRAETETYRWRME